MRTVTPKAVDDRERFEGDGTKGKGRVDDEMKCY